MKTDIKKLRAKLEKHCVEITKHRDAMRTLIEDIEALEDDTSEAVMHLENAADALSRLQ